MTNKLNVEGRIDASGGPVDNTKSEEMNGGSGGYIYISFN